MQKIKEMEHFYSEKMDKLVKTYQSQEKELNHTNQEWKDHYESIKIEN